METNMKINLKSTSLVKPAVPTYNGNFHLSILDQIGCTMHIPTIYFYRRTDPEKFYQLETIMNTLKSSLSKLLVHFYPLAGRLHYVGAGRMVLECNGKGVELIEAACDSKMDVLGDFTPSPQFHYLFPNIDYKNSSIHELPLLYVQLTEFQCGGVALSLTMSHAVADGQSALHFILEWARIAHGAQLGIEPFHDRKILNGRDIVKTKVFRHMEYQSPPLLIGQSSNENERKKPTTIALLKLEKHQVEALKTNANAGKSDMDTGRPYSRYEVIAAHVWRSACKSRKLPRVQETRISICMDIRGHIDPPIPRGYFGNAIIDVCSLASSGDLLSNSLSFAANKIRESISEVTSDYVNSAIKFLEKQNDLSVFQDLHALKHDEGPFYGNPNIQVISWLSLPYYDLDLGWGKEICMRPGTLDSDGDCVLLPSYENDGSVIVSLCLQQDHMEDFSKWFYQH